MKHMNPESPKVRADARASFPTKYGEFTIYGFEYEPAGEPFVVLSVGDIGAASTPLVRIHSQCLTGDVLGSLRCDCGDQLAEALRTIHASGCGLLIYQLQEGRGIGILKKLQAYQLQDEGADTVEANEMLGFEADLRQYDGCVDILRYFGVERVRLMSNNPDKVSALEQGGIEVVDRVPLEICPHQRSREYLRTKKEKMGHLLENV